MTELQVVALVAMQEGGRDVGWLLYCIIEHLVCRVMAVASDLASSVSPGHLLAVYVEVCVMIAICSCGYFLCLDVPD